MLVEGPWHTESLIVRSLLLMSLRGTALKMNHQNIRRWKAHIKTHRSAQQEETYSREQTSHPAQSLFCWPKQLIIQFQAFVKFMHIFKWESAVLKSICNAWYNRPRTVVYWGIKECLNASQNRLRSLQPISWKKRRGYFQQLQLNIFCHWLYTCTH